jgi:hypothetical protein
VKIRSRDGLAAVLEERRRLIAKQFFDARAFGK